MNISLQSKWKQTFNRIQHFNSRDLSILFESKELQLEWDDPANNITLSDSKNVHSVSDRIQFVKLLGYLIFAVVAVILCNLRCILQYTQFHRKTINCNEGAW